MIIISAVIIMMTVVMVIADVVAFMALRCGGATKAICSAPCLVYYLVSSDTPYVCVYNYDPYNYSCSNISLKSMTNFEGD